jgi:tetratricopeptide (TPR) repeat protein
LPSEVKDNTMGAAASFQGQPTPPLLDNVQSAQSPRPPCEYAPSTTLPLMGLRLVYHEEFIKQCGGRQALEGLSTRIVVDRFIIPLTQSNRSSFCEMLQQSNHPAVDAKAKYFIIHCWDENFLEQIDALQSIFPLESGRDVSCWWDIFSLPQHNMHTDECDHGDHWFATTLPKGIKRIGNAVLLCTRWDIDSFKAPNCLARTWCLFELFLVLSNNLQLSVAFPAHLTMKKILPTIELHHSSSFLQWKDQISINNSKCFHEEDRRRIVDRLDAVGRAVVHARVFDGFFATTILSLQQLLNNKQNDVDERQQRNWTRTLIDLLLMAKKPQQALSLSTQLLADLSAATAQTEQEAYFKQEKIMSMFAHAKILKSLQKYSEALAVSQDCQKQGVDTLATASKELVMSMSLFDSDCLIQLHRYEESEALLNSCLGKYRKENYSDIVGNEMSLEQRQQHIEVTLGMGKLNAIQCQWPKAVMFFRSSISLSHQYFGDSWLHILLIEGWRGLLFSLIETQSNTRNLALDSEIATIFEKCREMSTTLWGEGDVRTLSFLTNFADLNVRQEVNIQKDQATRNFKTPSTLLAEEIYVDCLQKKSQRLGINHPATLASMFALGEFYFDWQQWDKAEDILSSCFGLSQKSLSHSHRFTMSCANTLLRVYRIKKKTDDAVLLSESLLSVYRNVLGDTHSTTLTAITELADLYASQDRYASAIEYYLESYDSKRTQFGEKDGKTTTALGKLAFCYEKLQQYDKAEKLFSLFYENVKDMLGEKHPKTAAIAKNLQLLKQTKRSTGTIKDVAQSIQTSN